MQTLILWRLRCNTAPLAFAGILAISAANAQANSWTNPTSGNWEDASSWSLGGPPGTDHGFAGRDLALYEWYYGRSATVFPSETVKTDRLQ